MPVARLGRKVLVYRRLTRFTQFDSWINSRGCLAKPRISEATCNRKIGLTPSPPSLPPSLDFEGPSRYAYAASQRNRGQRVPYSCNRSSSGQEPAFGVREIFRSSDCPHLAGSHCRCFAGPRSASRPCKTPSASAPLRFTRLGL